MLFIFYKNFEIVIVNTRNIFIFIFSILLIFFFLVLKKQFHLYSRKSDAYWKTNPEGILTIRIMYHMYQF